jgi:hypothetical protein
MQTIEGQMTQHELATQITANLHHYLDAGALALLFHAGKLNQAVREWEAMPYPRLESPAGIKAREAGDAFSQAYTAYCERQAKKTNDSLLQHLPGQQ